MHTGHNKQRLSCNYKQSYALSFNIIIKYMDDNECSLNLNDCHEPEHVCVL